MVFEVYDWRRANQVWEHLTRLPRSRLQTFNGRERFRFDDVGSLMARHIYFPWFFILLQALDKKSCVFRVFLCSNSLLLCPGSSVVGAAGRLIVSRINSICSTQTQFRGEFSLSIYLPENPTCRILRNQFYSEAIKDVFAVQQEKKQERKKGKRKRW